MTYRITRESLCNADACWFRTADGTDRLLALVPPEGVTVTVEAVRAALAAGVPAADVHWSMVYAAGASDRILREHACWCARTALALVSAPDPRSLAAVETAEMYARGEASEEELRAAEDAADCAAARAADYAISRAVAWDAARAAALTARASAAYAADYAAGAAAGEASEAQCLDLAARLSSE